MTCLLRTGGLYPLYPIQMNRYYYYYLMYLIYMIYIIISYICICWLHLSFLLGKNKSPCVHSHGPANPPPPPSSLPFPAPWCPPSPPLPPPPSSSWKVRLPTYLASDQ